ncbi:hypothetical protein [Pleomorphovibrio marinus]|uniref:hypothetical protein n=1 Tax=Pleomorphovibrio marinus TaxID=2164132 RepID=UPI000E0C365B|nr:hypothetical protein [Pleomorphovibrio marinus]
MFQKTPSEDSILFTEIKKEFGTLHEKGKKSMGNLLANYPRQCFGAMVVTLMLSAVLAFIVPPFNGEKRQEETRLIDEVNHLGSGIADEFSTLFKIGNEAKRIGQLKSEVERIIAQEEIDLQDSIFLENAILELKRYHPINPQHHED